MTWRYSAAVTLRNERVPDADADRQTRTAEEILRRFDEQPGVILADEVGMGKTYVALAVAASVLEATKRANPVIVMVPLSVADKWPREWSVFADRCLPADHGLRAPDRPVRRGSDLLKLLDDPVETRNDLIFVTHGALTRTLTDPYVCLALLREAIARDPDLARRQRTVARYAHRLLNAPQLRDEALVLSLLQHGPDEWRQMWNQARPDHPLDDDPVPAAVLDALRRVDLSALQQVVEGLPVNDSPTLETRLKQGRARLSRVLRDAWTASLRTLDLQLPLVIVDEAHHVRHETQLTQLLAHEGAELKGPLGGIFDHMLFLTATPFQLDHRELVRVLERFQGVRWPSPARREQFGSQLTALGAALDRARATALRLERAWTRIDAAQAPAVASLTAFEPEQAQPEAVRTALAIAAEARAELGEAERLLRPWVIRHRMADRSVRRRYLAGAGILGEGSGAGGLPIGGEAVLPFLLAARAQAVASLAAPGDVSRVRAYYAYGLASSFEAYKDTRRDHDDEPGDALAPADERLGWYLSRIEAALPRDNAHEWAQHPKVAATVQRVLELWRDGEKCLVFCFYRETGRALRAHISRALRAEIVTRARPALELEAGASDDEVLSELDRLSERLLHRDGLVFSTFHDRLTSYVRGLDPVTTRRVVDIVVRFMRTPSFLVRFVDLSPDLAVDGLLSGLHRPDASGVTFADRVEAFAATVVQLVAAERDELLAALEGIQTGGISVTGEHFDASERARHREVLLPNVRLANGEVRLENRQRLMLTFNTPFFPEILIASAVMAEGVDLHHDCRYVIHHDLDWNPSVLEQRTGRVDRLGSKAERVSQPVVVYEPYLGGTHDEKMFRVVKDRERWFGVVMGESPDSSEWSTEKEAVRVPLPLALSSALTMDLALPVPSPPSRATPLVELDGEDERGDQRSEDGEPGERDYK
jgi:hypothetical protein